MPAPVDGRVTREDLDQLYREFASQTRRALAYGEMDAPPTIEEYHRYLVGAILDPPPRKPLSVAARRRMAAGQRRRRDRERGREATPIPAEVVRAAA